MDKIQQIRRFNRNITRRIGVLENNFLGRPRPLGASRILYETGVDGLEIRELRGRLGLDSGYLTRLLNILRSENLIRSESSDSDSRAKRISLTDKGRTELDILNALSDESAYKIITSLSDKQQQELVESMSRVEKLLTAAAVTFEVVEPHSRIGRLCLSNYYRELDERFSGGFDPGKSVSTGKKEFCPPSGYFLCAMLDGTAAGCGAVRFLDDYAEIKRMWVSETLRGTGIGGRLLSGLEKLGCDAGYHLIRLDTNRSLTEALSFYSLRGYSEIPRYNSEPYADHWFEKRL